MTTPTQGDRADFAAFCAGATTAQLRAIMEKEAKAGRRVYAQIAKDELASRGA